DAALACEHGADAIVVSNHGGRQLDFVAGTLDALPEVAEAVDGRIEVLLDGGIRRGVDVVKALALGARACLAGRAVLWGLTVDADALRGDPPYEADELDPGAVVRDAALCEPAREDGRARARDIATTEREHVRDRHERAHLVRAVFERSPLVGSERRHDRAPEV